MSNTTKTNTQATAQLEAKPVKKVLQTSNGGFLVHPFTSQRITAEGVPTVLDNWLQCQLDAGVLKEVD